MEWALLALVAAVVLWLGRGARPGAGPGAGAVAAARATATEDVTRFGEELRRLETVRLADEDEAARREWQRAVDGYEAADRALGSLTGPEDVRQVTEALEEGRHAAACVQARREGRPAPPRRPPCFFDPAHGPSVRDVQWAPPEGTWRPVPVCAADAERLARGADPHVRTVPTGRRGQHRVPYWEAGPAYLPWAGGYFSPYAAGGILPGFMTGTLLAQSAGMAPLAETGPGPDAGAGGLPGDAPGGGFGGGFDGGGLDGGF